MKWNRLIKPARLERAELVKQWHRWKIRRDTFEAQDKHTLCKRRYNREQIKRETLLALRSWGIWLCLVLMIGGLLGWIGCQFSVPVSMTNWMTTPAQTWVLTLRDQQIILQYFQVLQRPWQQRRVYPVLPDLEMGC